MPCGRAQVVRDPAFVTVVSVAVVTAVIATLRWGARGFALSAGGALAAAPLARAQLMRRVVRRSVGVQRRALAARRIDVVVGSSFGGAVALWLLANGAWSGPTVLLCPAHQLVARRCGWPPPTLASLPIDSSRVVVVHGRADTTVPVAHSHALVEGSRARLVLVDDDHRLAASATPERFAEWVALAQGRRLGRTQPSERH
jgi:fermentation-respiration switch protein FrsA (DUF1100 family)